MNFGSTVDQLVGRALEGAEDKDVVDEEAVADDDDQKAGEEKKPKVTNSDLRFCLGGEKRQGGFFIHLDDELFGGFPNTSKSSIYYLYSLFGVERPFHMCLIFLSFHQLMLRLRLCTSPGFCFSGFLLQRLIVSAII